MTEWLNDPLHDDGYQLPTLPDCGFRDTFTFSDLSAIVPASNAMEPQLMHTPMLGHGWEPSFQCSSATALAPFPSDDATFYSPAVASPTSSTFSGLLEAPGMFTYDEQVELLNPLWAYLCDDEASDGGPSDYGRQWDVESAVDWLM